MSNIYLKVAIEEKNWLSQNFDFIGFKYLSQCQILGAPTHSDIIELENFLLQLKNRRSGGKSLFGFSIILILKGITTFLSQRAHAFCWIKI